MSDRDKEKINNNRLRYWRRENQEETKEVVITA
jgi:hypothetical protein